jgi:hypothetical protein
MSLLSNVKAQTNRVFKGLKQTPVAQGIKNNLVEPGLFENAKLNTMGRTRTDLTKREAELSHALASVGSPKQQEVARNNQKLAQTFGLDDMEDERTREFLRKRVGENGLLRETQDSIIKKRLNVAGLEGAVSGNKPWDKSMAQSLLTRSAQETDGGLAFMTPLEAAKEYYGAPVKSAMSNLKNKDYQAFGRDALKVGIRGGATAGVIGGGVALGNGAVNLAQRGVNAINGNTQPTPTE